MISKLPYRLMPQIVLLKLQLLHVVAQGGFDPVYESAAWPPVVSQAESSSWTLNCKLHLRRDEEKQIGCNEDR